MVSTEINAETNKETYKQKQKIQNRKNIERENQTN